MSGTLTLVSGPSSGGKSRWAEHLAASSGRQVVYLATGPTLPDDPDWQHRLTLHRNRRPSSWQCREVGRHLAEALGELGSDQLGLVDSLGTWVTAGLDWDRDTWEEACGGLLVAIRDCEAPVVLVCEEVGWGVVPATKIGGLFRDRQGHLQQRLMALCTAAWLVLQGRAVDLLALSQPVPELPET
ncbi:bifunctional adenosylcobinamide kinase/adenosylcobinamide-phosphate guanylyltransferase [Synechococcus sp. CS-1328]|uniref:bifunctional adenosylcobinamide kinase/adenosylcobinamide-phosphate guanylyltransferase n=1 Tax=Synechococcus sp. CS-1328 TaxID=2847976 RepID=UPI0028801830|nr:bifunctional adenosylcobinamide kinase/adenosylcobinamide-phosphate guanylyltransferase [Synechococcus sp. CS-1328]